MESSNIDFNENPILTWSQYPVKKIIVEVDTINNCWKLNGITTNDFTFNLNYDTIYLFDISNISSLRNFTILDPNGSLLNENIFKILIPNKLKILQVPLNSNQFYNYLLIKDINDPNFGGANDNCPHFSFNSYRKISQNRLLRRNDRLLTQNSINLTISGGITGDQISIIPLSGTPNITTLGDITFMNGATSGVINNSTILFYVDNSWFFKQ
jgi:hypothetical protein